MPATAQGSLGTLAQQEMKAGLTLGSIKWSVLHPGSPQSPVMMLREA